MANNKKKRKSVSKSSSSKKNNKSKKVITNKKVTKKTNSNKSVTEKSPKKVSKISNIENGFKNNKEDEILKMLPGYNCGACGFGSCSGMMHALMKDKNAINKCRVCKNKEEIIKFLGDINEK